MLYECPCCGSHKFTYGICDYCKSTIKEQKNKSKREFTIDSIETVSIYSLHDGKLLAEFRHN